MRRQLVVGNWKMHGSRAANAELLTGILAAARPFARLTWRSARRSSYLSESGSGTLARH